MSEGKADELQFDRVITAGSSAPGASGVTCAGCRSSILTEYYDVNGHSVCEACRTTIEAAAETPRGIVPLAIAGLFGLGAAVAGAAIYYAVIAIANLEVGLIAILCGYMVGYAVRKGAGGRGGRRFQVLAVLLTYLSVALAYTPVVVMQIREEQREAQKAAAAGGDPQAAAPSEEPVPVALAIALLIGGILALPVLVVIGSLPSGLITLAIIGFGVHQAWKMTGTVAVLALGPYQVGGGTAASV